MKNKHLTIQQWAKVLKKLDNFGINEAVNLYCKLKVVKYTNYANLRHHILNKYHLWENKDMAKTKRRKSNKKLLAQDKNDIKGIIKALTREQLEEIADDWLKEQRKKKAKDKVKKIKKFNKFNNNEGAIILHYSQCSQSYKPVLNKKYKWDSIIPKIVHLFKNSNEIFGAPKIKLQLLKEGIDIPISTIGWYMHKLSLRSVYIPYKTRKKKEEKNTKFSAPDLVKGNNNPNENYYIATDVTEIKANVLSKRICLSATINLKSKYIESWAISTKNDTQLVLDTFKQLDRKNIIIHSDHGTTYTSYAVQNFIYKNKWKQSMGRVGKCLDNREIEFFWSLIKRECLNRYKTAKKSIKEIKKLVSNYINWYNLERIQSVLDGRTPHQVKYSI